MTPFQEFRTWLHTASAGDRAAAATAIAIALALVVWVAGPPSGGSSAQMSLASTGGNPAAGPAADPAAGGAPPTGGGAAGASSTGGVGGSSSTGSGGGTSPAGTGGTTRPSATPGNTVNGGASGCTAPPGSDQGVTATQIKLAFILVDISGAAANSAFQVPSPAHQQELYQASLDDTNARGGVACRKLIGQFYPVNPLDQSSLQGACLTIAEAKPFAVIDLGSYTNSLAIAQCFPQHQIPFFSGTPLPDKLRDENYPYFFGGYAKDTVYRNTVFALQQRGYFSSANGFVTLGFFYKDCAPEVNDKILGWLKQVGVPASKIVTYNGGCPTPFVSPADVQQAILKFQQAGVTHVLMAQVLADTQTFTNTAQQQGFRPKYAFAGIDIVGSSYGPTKPNYDNIANAIAINPDRYAEERTPGSVPNAATVRCNAILKKHGWPSVYEANDAGVSGYACDQVWQFTAALQHAPRLARNALAAGFQAAKSIDFSYPWGPNNLTGLRTTSPGQFWRPVQFMPACSCWRIIDRTFHPSFP